MMAGSKKPGQGRGKFEKFSDEDLAKKMADPKTPFNDVKAATEELSRRTEESIAASQSKFNSQEKTVAQQGAKLDNIQNILMGTPGADINADEVSNLINEAQKSLDAEKTPALNTKSPKGTPGKTGQQWQDDMENKLRALRGETNAPKKTDQQWQEDMASKLRALRSEKDAPSTTSDSSSLNTKYPNVYEKIGRKLTDAEEATVIANEAMEAAALEKKYPKSNTADPKKSAADQEWEELEDEVAVTPLRPLSDMGDTKPERPKQPTPPASPLDKNPTPSDSDENKKAKPIEPPITQPVKTTDTVPVDKSGLEPTKEALYPPLDDFSPQNPPEAETPRVENSTPPTENLEDKNIYPDLSEFMTEPDPAPIESTGPSRAQGKNAGPDSVGGSKPERAPEKSNEPEALGFFGALIKAIKDLIKSIDKLLNPASEEQSKTSSAKSAHDLSYRPPENPIDTKNNDSLSNTSRSQLRVVSVSVNNGKVTITDSDHQEMTPPPDSQEESPDDSFRPK